MRMSETSVAVEVRNTLIVQHLGLVKALALRLARRVPAQVEVSELVSAGVIGLVDAATRYKPSLGVPFDAFARRRVQGAMLDSLRGLDWAPRSVRRMRRELDEAIARVRSVTGREPEGVDIANELGVSEAEYDRMLDQVRALDIGAIRQQSAGLGRGSILELALDPQESALERIERSELREHLVHALEGLPERERRVLSLYYEHELTLAEIGAVIGVGESRVSQLRTQAIARLRSRLRETLHLSEAR
jgi:RNA polymerase sigma factor for flagellar operon FliA